MASKIVIRPISPSVDIFLRGSAIMRLSLFSSKQCIIKQLSVHVGFCDILRLRLITLMYRSNRSLNIPPRQSPGPLNFWKIFVQIPPSRGQKAVQMPHYRSIPDDQIPPTPGKFSVASIMLRKLCM